MSKWIEVKLKDVCEKITVGHVGSMADQYRETGIPFLRSLNIKPYRIDFNNLKFIDEQFNQKLKKSVLMANDVAIIRTGYPGTACVIPKSLGIANCSDLVIVRPGNQLNPYFLASIFNSTFGKDLVSGNLVGAAQQHFNITVAKELKLRLPPKNLQDKIAAVLSAYDDLIENNDRRITLLEKMAEEIYRKWFVRLRFPGHEQTTFHKGIPEGWEVRDLKDSDISIVDGDRGTNYPRKDEFNESGYCLFLNTGNIKNDKLDFSKNDFITKQKDLTLRKGKLMDNDIILTTRGTVGSVAFYSKNLVYRNARINSGMVIVRPKNGENDALYYYYLLKSSLLKEQYRLYSSGSAQPQLPIKDLKRINILIPPQEKKLQFCNLANVLRDQLDRLELVNQYLKQTRDRLLTRLISGKLSIEDLDIQFPPSMTTDP
jgi:type I restriction enzyme, S subunit